jgi:hypothetical protein
VPRGLESSAVPYQVIHYFIVPQAHTHRLFDNPKSTKVRSSGTMTRHYSLESGNKFHVLPLTLKPRPKRNPWEYGVSESTSVCNVLLPLTQSQQNRSCQTLKIYRRKWSDRTAPFNAACHARSSTISLPSTSTPSSNKSPHICLHS